jgi:hypothetical protein
MNCPPQIASILLEMIRTGLLRIRALGWSEQPELCALEADHIHNLPELLSDYSTEKLAYYWDVERPAYIEHWRGQPPREWGPLWERLESVFAVRRTTS